MVIRTNNFKPHHDFTDTLYVEKMLHILALWIEIGSIVYLSSLLSVLENCPFLLCCFVASIMESLLKLCDCRWRGWGGVWENLKQEKWFTLLCRCI